MSKQVQFRGGNSADHAAFVGAPREVTVVTDDWSLRVHDGTTAGGHPISGGAGVALDNIAALRALDSDTSPESIQQTCGYYVPGDGGCNEFYCDLADTTSVDDGANCIKDAANRRWKSLEKTFNAKKWGCKGDGSTNDTVRGQAMIDAALPIDACMYFPKGVYKLNLFVLADATKWWRRIVLYGDGPGEVGTKFIPADNALPIFWVKDYSGFTIRDIRFGGAVVGGLAGIGLKLGDNVIGTVARCFSCSNLYFRDLDKGLQIDGAYIARFETIEMSNCNNGVYTRPREGGTGGGPAFTASMFTHLDLSAMRQAAIQLDGGLIDALTFLACTIEGNDKQAFVMHNTVAGGSNPNLPVAFIGCYCEDNNKLDTAGYDFEVQAPVTAQICQISFENCWIVNYLTPDRKLFRLAAQGTYKFRNSLFSDPIVLYVADRSDINIDIDLPPSSVAIDDGGNLPVCIFRDKGSVDIRGQAAHFGMRSPGKTQDTAVLTDSTLSFGPGTGPVDAVLRRGTDGSIQVDGYYLQIKTTGSAIINAITPGDSVSARFALTQTGMEYGTGAAVRDTKFERAGAAPNGVWKSTASSIQLFHSGAFIYGLLTGDAQFRLALDSTGLEYGDGAVVRDTFLKRVAAGVWDIKSAFQLVEMTEPATPPANKAVLFLRDNAGKTELCAKFQSGTVVPICKDP